MKCLLKESRDEDDDNHSNLSIHIYYHSSDSDINHPKKGPYYSHLIRKINGDYTESIVERAVEGTITDTVCLQ